MLLKIPHACRGNCAAIFPLCAPAEWDGSGSDPAIKISHGDKGTFVRFTVIRQPVIKKNVTVEDWSGQLEE